MKIKYYVEFGEKRDQVIQVGRLCGIDKKFKLIDNEARDNISSISYAGCFGLSPLYFSENSL